jgi:hypothetical protein
VIKAADGKLAVTIDWEWFEQHRERLLAKQASGKKITPEIYQRHLPRVTRHYDSDLQPICDGRAAQFLPRELQWEIRRWNFKAGQVGLPT